MNKIEEQIEKLEGIKQLIEATKDDIASITISAKVGDSTEFRQKINPDELIKNLEKQIADLKTAQMNSCE